MPGADDLMMRVYAAMAQNERELIDVAIAEAVDGVGIWVRQGIEAAMNRLNAPTNSSRGDSSSGGGQ